MNYHVTWEIDLEAATPREAAELARDMQIGPGSSATVFTVEERGPDRRKGYFTIDVADEPNTD
jgi:hypothetical protein